VKQLELEGGRLRFKRLSGTGPDVGWVSTFSDGQELMAPVCALGDNAVPDVAVPPTSKVSPESEKDYWKVVGGKTDGGLLVRRGQSLESNEARSRLSCGALVKQLHLENGRLRYKLLAGSGPDTGWVSIAAAGQDLVVKADAH